MPLQSLARFGFLPVFDHDHGIVGPIGFCLAVLPISGWRGKWLSPCPERTAEDNRGQAQRRPRLVMALKTAPRTQVIDRKQIWRASRLLIRRRCTREGKVSLLEGFAHNPDTSPAGTPANREPSHPIYCRPLKRIFVPCIR
jgi:hypothetical protein